MSKKSVLVIDDDFDISESMKTVLELNGFTVWTADNREDGIKAFSDHNPDVVFLDLMMEKVDSGLEICKVIREKNKDVKIYLLSSVSDEAGSNIDLHEMGFNGAMQKPVKPDELIELASA